MRSLPRVALESLVEYLAPRLVLALIAAIAVGLAIAPWWALGAIVTMACCAGALLRSKRVQVLQQSRTNAPELCASFSSPEASFQKKKVVASTDKRQKEKRVASVKPMWEKKKKIFGGDMGVVAVEEKKGREMMFVAWPGPPAFG